MYLLVESISVEVFFTSEDQARIQAARHVSRFNHQSYNFAFQCSLNLVLE